MPSIPGASSLTVPAEGSVGLSSHLMMPWEDWLESNFNLGFCGLVTQCVGWGFNGAIHLSHCACEILNLPLVLGITGTPSPITSILTVTSTGVSKATISSHHDGWRCLYVGCKLPKSHPGSRRMAPIVGRPKWLDIYNWYDCFSASWKPRRVMRATSIGKHN